jgi:hypothetical protein
LLNRKITGHATFGKNACECCDFQRLRCENQIVEFEKIKPLNRISLFIIFRVFINFCMISSYICIISIHIRDGSDKQPGKSLMYIKNNSGPG